MDKKYIQKLLIILAVIITLLVIIGCKKKVKEREKLIYFKAKTDIFKKWDALFPEHKIDNPNFPSAFYFLTMNSKGDFFLYSRRDEKIVQFDNKWKFVQEIAKKGEGPGEFQIPWPVICDTRNNLYIYDIGKRAINVFSFPNYHFSKQIKLTSHVSKMEN